jgi:hypothetical protein
LENRTEENEEYSVFNEVKEPEPPKKAGHFQRFVYFTFAAIFLVRAILRWTYFTTIRSYSVADGHNALNERSLPYLISAISTSAILLASLVLYFRQSVRAAVALFIIGAVLELLIFYFLKAH